MNGLRLQFLLPGVLLLASGCGQPKPLDLRAEMNDSIRTLGADSFYPLREAPRIGSIHLVDRSAADVRKLAPTDETNMLLTETLVPDFELARRNRTSMRAGGRFPESDAGISASLQPANNGVGYYRQTGTSPPSAATKPVPAARRGARPAPASAAQEQNLALAAFPGFTLASVDQASLAANIPTPFASFLGAFGLRHTSYLKMEAEGVEYSDLPLDSVLDIIRKSCSAPDGMLGNGGRNADAIALVRTATFKMEADSASRKAPSSPFSPQLGIITRIYYLRGIRFIIDDSRVAGVIAQASLASRLPAGVTAPSVPAITINNAAPATPAGGTPSRTAASDAQIDGMLQSIQSLRTALSSSTQAGFATTAARATARGVELVDVFDRPLAFGYVALWARVKTPAQLEQDGLASLCAFTPPPLH